MYGVVIVPVIHLAICPSLMRPKTITKITSCAYLYWMRKATAPSVVL